jgi:hypothetical protein
LLTLVPNVKVRITETPREMEIDGVRLDGFRPGTVRDVSSLLGAWLVAERYAEPEMRKNVGESAEDFSDVKDFATRARAGDGPRRRSNDW